MLGIVLTMFAQSCSSNNTNIQTPHATPNYATSTLITAVPTVLSKSSSPVSSNPTNTPTTSQIVVMRVPDSTEPISDLKIPIPPDRELHSLYGSLTGKNYEQLSEYPIYGPTDRIHGDRETFWAINLNQLKPFEIKATLRHISKTLYMFVDDSVKVQESDLKKAAEHFETIILPKAEAWFGPMPSSTTGNNPRITVLNTRLPRVSGYFNSSDLLPKTIYPYSNEQLMLYMNVASLRPGTEQYTSTLAHEFQHILHRFKDPSEEVWINEGLSVIAEEIVNIRPKWSEFFEDKPETPLTSWAIDTGKSAPNYGAAHLFLSYLFEKYGKPDRSTSIRELVYQDRDGIAGIDAFLENMGFSVRFEDVFKDWIIANYLNEEPLSSYGYEMLSFQLTPTKTLSEQGLHLDSVNQFSADYIRIAPKDQDFRVVFEGQLFSKILPNDAHSGQWQWWGNRGDAIDTTLSRRFDLSSISDANLDFWVWYDIEQDFDHAYVEASIDDGNTWDILRGPLSSLENPLGLAIGPSYTGASNWGESPQWIQESISLADYVGDTVRLRFHYVTDEAVNSHGFAIDDISIPQIGFYDDAETGGLWEAQGFYRTNNKLPQRFIVQVIIKDGETRVLDIPLSPLGKGGLVIREGQGDLSELVLVIAGASEVTSQPAVYKLTIEPLP